MCLYNINYEDFLEHLNFWLKLLVFISEVGNRNSLLCRIIHLYWLLLIHIISHELTWFMKSISKHFIGQLLNNLWKFIYSNPHSIY